MLACLLSEEREGDLSTTGQRNMRRAKWRSSRRNAWMFTQWAVCPRHPEPMEGETAIVQAVVLVQRPPCAPTYENITKCTNLVHNTSFGSCWVLQTGGAPGQQFLPLTDWVAVPVLKYQACLPSSEEALTEIPNPKSLPLLSTPQPKPSPLMVYDFLRNQR